jgi:hypothetical protein
MKSEAYSPGLKLNGSGSANPRGKLRMHWASIERRFQKWKLAKILALTARLNTPEFWESKLKSKMMEFKIKLGRKYWTIKPPMDIQQPFVRPWLVQFAASDQGVDYFKDDNGAGFLVSSEKNPAEFLFESADQALNAYYQRKIHVNEAKVFELLEENKIYYTMIKSIL